MREGRRDGFHRDCSEFWTTEVVHGMSRVPREGRRGKWEEGPEGGEGSDLHLLGGGAT